MNEESIALLIHPEGGFEVRKKDQFGNDLQLALAHDLGECLKQAARAEGISLVIPISGPKTRF